jgi:hypothetical protein
MWIVVPVALLAAFVIWRVGIATLRSLTMTSPPGSASDEPAPAAPEDVDDLGVYLVSTGFPQSRERSVKIALRWRGFVHDVETVVKITRL